MLKQPPWPNNEDYQRRTDDETRELKKVSLFGVLDRESVKYERDQGSICMTFGTEPTEYVKTALSDLQGAWMNLRDSVVENFGFPESERILFHIDEAMSWESVRNLQSMKSTLLLIRNISIQTETPDAVQKWIENVRQCLEEALSEIVEDRAE